MPSQKRQSGDKGENKAVEFLLEHRYKIIDRNFRIKNLGEIDIVAEKKNKLYFIEVKTRDVKHETYFPIQFSIDEKKRKNLKRICQLYLIDKKLENKNWQVDAIFVKRETIHKDQVEHLENILWEKYY